MTTYLGYKTPEMPVEVYTGFDYERFSSFNTGELLIGEDISTRENTLFYGTLGIGKIFQFLNKR